MYVGRYTERDGTITPRRTPLDVAGRGGAVTPADTAWTMAVERSGNWIVLFAPALIASSPLFPPRQE